MSDLQVKIYTYGDRLPSLLPANFFHSPELFRLIGNSSGQRPYMVVVSNSSDEVLAHMLAFVRRRTSWLPPFIFTQGRIYGEGAYRSDEHKEELFSLMVHALTRRLKRKLCFFIEFSNLSRKMFGYRVLRKEGYFPINWQEVHNSLHSLPPRERLSQKMADRIAKALALGVETREATTPGEIHDFYRLLKGYYRFKVRRYIPSEDYFVNLHQCRLGRIFITLYRGRVIGGSACVYSEGNAYLWFFASRRKSYHFLHPNIITVWCAIEWAWKHNYAHIFFLDVGLPFSYNLNNVLKNPFREFILSFGGKPVAKYRWFRINVKCVNRLIELLYKE